MLQLTINGEPRTLPNTLSLTELLNHLQLDPRKVAIMVNHEVVPRVSHPSHVVRNGDAIEIATFVGGGSGELPADKPLRIGKFTFRSRLITGTGKYASYELMRDCLEASACEVTTVAVRRERLTDKEGRNILDYLDLK